MFPSAEITFLVGSDKVLQIFDDRWYEDRADAMDRLFTNARLLVAPRSDQGEDLRDALRAAGNGSWADRVEVLRLHPAVSDLSSTRVRGLLRAGAEPAGLVPPAVAELLDEMRAFAPPIVIGCEEVDVYEVRTKLIDLLWRSRGLNATNVELRTLMRIALSGTEAGARLRAMLSEGNAQPEDLVRAYP
jgi:nicotinamide-nucleotide adenylyltransferase